METGDLISFYRKQSGLTIDELAEKSGVPKGTLNKIIGGVTKAPTLDTMKAIARALGKRLADFDDFPLRSDAVSAGTNAGGRVLSAEAMKLARDFDTLDVWGRRQLRATADVEIERCVALEEAAQHEAGSVIPLRRSLQPASAGTGTYLGPEEFETIFVADNELTRKAAFAIPVSGSSMEPRYRDGDVLLIEGADDIAVGEIGVFTLDGDGYIKQRGDDELISLNPEFLPVKMTQDIWCNGRVIGVLDPAWVR